MVLTYLNTVRLFNRNVQMYLIIVALIGLTVDGGIVSVLLNLFVLRLGHGPELVGQINAAGMLTFALASMPAGALGSRWGPRIVMVCGLGVMSLGLTLISVASSIPPAWQKSWLLTHHVTTMFGLALYFVNAGPFLMASASPATRNHVFSVHASLWALSGSAGSFLGGLLPGWFAMALQTTLDQPTPYGYPLAVAGLLLIPAMVAALSTRPVDAAPSAAGQPTPPIGAGAMGYSVIGLILLLSAIRLIQVSGVGAGLIFFNVYLDDGLQTPTAQIGMLTALGRLVGAPAALITPLILARLGSSGTIVMAGLGSALCLLPLALAPHWASAGLGYMGMVALNSIRYPALLLFSMELVPARWRGTMSGLSEAAGGLSFALVALVGGYLIAAVGYRPLFLSGAILAGLGSLGFWFVFRIPRGEQAQGRAANGS